MNSRGDITVVIHVICVINFTNFSSLRECGQQREDCGSLRQPTNQPSDESPRTAVFGAWTE